MPESSFPPVPDRARLRRAVGDRLVDLDPTLRPLAEDVLGGSGRIDWLARDGSGRATVILIGAPGEDAALLTRALAERAWVGPRIGDWLKLAPELGLAPEATPVCWLLCPEFGPATRTAHRAVSDDGLRLARLGFRRAGEGEELEVWLQPLAVAASEPGVAQPRPPQGEAGAPRPAPFRSGLREEDFALTEAERRTLLAGGDRPGPAG